MKYLVLSAFVLIVLVLLYCYRKWVMIETFAGEEDNDDDVKDEPIVYSKWLNSIKWTPTEQTNIIQSDSLTTQPFTIYYTKDIEKCNSPGAFYVGGQQDETFKIDYSFDVAYYKALFDKLKSSYNGVNKSPTPQENSILLEVDDIIQQYSKFIDANKTTCKYTIPNWVNFTPKTEKLVLGDLPQNDSRGPPEHWVTIGKRTDQTQLQTIGVKPLQTPYENPQNYYIKVDGQDTMYSMNMLQNYSYETVRDLYCKEDNGVSYTMSSGICVNPSTKEVSFVKNGKIIALSDMTDLDIIIYFKYLFQTQSVTDDVSTETVIIRPETFTKQVTRLRKTICDTVVKELTPVHATIYFTDVAKLKEIQKGVDTKYYQGTSSTLANTDTQLNNDISAQQKKIQEAFTAFSETQQRLNANQVQVEDLTNQVRDMDKIMASFNATLADGKAMKRMGRNGRRNFRNSVATFSNSLNVKKGELGMLITQQADILSSLQTRRNEYAAAVEVLNYYMKIKNNINEFLVYMDTVIINNIRQLLAQKSMEVSFTSKTMVPEYLRYLSYDGNLYISLD